MLFWEDQLRAKFGSRLRIVEEKRSENMLRVTVYVDEQPIAESGMRELACKYALDDLRDGKIVVFADVPQQLPLMGL